MKKLLVLGLLISIIFLSGCVRQKTETTYGTGVEIKELTVEPSVIESMKNARVIVNLLVQNTGEVEASGVRATLLGLPDDEWKVENREQQVGDGTLYPANPSVGLPEGEQGYVTWTLTVPSGKFTQTTYPFSVKVSYKYKTIAEGIIRAVKLDYYRRTKDKGSVKSFSYTAGPLKVSVKVPNAIFSEGVRDIPLMFEIYNIGGGRTYSSIEDGATIDQIEVKSSSETLDCPVSKVTLASGQRALVSCTLKIKDTTQDYKDISFRVDLNYWYVIEEPSSITVLPQLVISS
ncbi:MAG: hypothetical protein J7L39_04175 [Candidatus Aenigmarchaeota archaeon]|nr:hypothetical protein [Candidatus Aenigmarchaeota archaeon]